MKKLLTILIIGMLLLGIGLHNMHPNILNKFCTKHPKFLNKFEVCKPICEHPDINGNCDKPSEEGNL